MQRLSRIAAGATILVALLVLAGWILGVPLPPSAFSGPATMKFNTALCFVCLGLSLWLAGDGSSHSSATRTRAGALLAGAAAVVAILTLVEHGSGASLGLDEIFLRDTAGGWKGLAPGRMAPNTALDLALLSASLLLLHGGRALGAQLVAAVAGLVAFLAIFGYAFGASRLYTWSGYASMAIHTSALFAILSLGILHARPDRGVMRAVASDGPGGTMARTLLPAVLLGPPVLGWLRVLGQEHGLYDTAQGTGLLVAATITLGMLLIVVNARALDRKEAERRRIQAALEERAQELERSNQELEHFAYVASHDLQEPLRIVASYAQLLQRRYASRLGQDADEFIQFIVDGANRMQQLILDLLSFSRIGTRGRRFEAVECETVLSEAVENLRAAVLESGASITHDPLPAVTADPTQLTQLFQNLLGNALKFRNAEPPRVHVSAERGESEWTFRVRDNGIGIAPEHRDRIFRMFQRLHTREQYPGTGIGLSLCKKVVERHGGKIWVEPAPGKGSIFCFTLPALGGNA